MFNLFRKKTEKEILLTKYKDLMAKCHKASSTDRKKSDQLFLEAHQVLKQIDEF